jgi:hypothetical protein
MELKDLQYREHGHGPESRPAGRAIAANMLIACSDND